MLLVLTGQTIADYGNPERRETLAGATVVFYAADKAAARTRWGIYPLSADSPPGREIGRAVVAADGSYEVRLRATADVILVAIEVSRFTYAPDTGKKVFGLLGPARPVLRKIDGEKESTIAAFNITMDPKAYGSLLEALDLWLVAGRVVAAGTSAGVNGVHVTAFDRDISQDDTLGGAATDATGSFEIFFPGDQFRQVPALPPPFNQIGLVELIGGPDLFFHVDAGTASLLEESPSMGRASGRENVPNISFTLLSVNLTTQLGATEQTGVTSWSHVGNIELIDIDAFGLTSSGQRAFFGSIELRGPVFRRSPLNGEPLRYRFLAKELSPATTAATQAMPPPTPIGSVDPNPPAPVGWTVLTGAAIAPSPYARIQTVTYAGGNYQVAYEDLIPAPNSNGWIEVDQRVLASNQYYIPSNVMIHLDTSKLVPEVAPTIAAPRKFALVLQVQTASSSFQQVSPNAPPASPFATALQMCNNGVYGKISIPQQTSACSPITMTAGTINISAKFEVSHPYLGGYRVVVQKWNGQHAEEMEEGSYTDPLNGSFWSGPTSQPVTATRNGYEVEPCSYEVRLIASPRLTNGITDMVHIEPFAAFCVR